MTVTAAALRVCFEFGRDGRACGGRVSWSPSIAGGFVGTCGSCQAQRRAVSGEQPLLEQETAP